MIVCPYHVKSDRLACTGAGHPYLPSAREIEMFCCQGGYTRCPVLLMESGELWQHFGDEDYWLLGPSQAT